MGFVAMFIVTPFLSNDPSIYGIYSICLSASIFFTYADLGFLGAAQKYAAEHFARNERVDEYGVIGFSGFLLLCLVAVSSLVIGFLALNPGILIKGIRAEERGIASSLLAILALSSPVMVLQRVVQIVFSIRLEDFRIQRVNVVGNLAKILSTFLFFGNGKYLIVEYFLFVQIVNVLAVSFSVILAKRKFHYDLRLFTRSFKFSQEQFRKTRKLAFSNLFLTVSWILYYECDSMVIGKVFGAAEAAIFAIGLSLLNLFRSVLGSLYSPFLSRFNHMRAQGDLEGLKRTYLKVMVLTAPIVLWTIATLELLMRPFIFTWVGSSYEPSIGIARLLVMSNVFAFISYPAGALLYAQERVRIMNIAGGLMPLLYWGGISLTYGIWGLESFGLFKFLTFTISAMIYLRVTVHFLGIPLSMLVKKILFPNMIPFLVLIITLFLVKDHLPNQQGKLDLTITILTGVGVAGATLLSCFLFNTDFRGYARTIISELRGTAKMGGEPFSP